MFYAEFMRGGKQVLWVVGCLTASALAIALIAVLFPHHFHAVGTNAQALDIVLWSAALVTAILGSMLGGSLATEKNHLALVWTKPISRTRYALGTMLVDLGYLAITFACALALGLWAASVIEGRMVVIDQAAALKAARFALFPLAWFGLAQALTAGTKTKGSCGWLIGFSWPTAEGLSIVATLPLVAPLHTALAFVNLANPLGYFPFWEVFDSAGGHSLRPYFGFGTSIDTMALLAIALAGLVIATARWRRLEA